MDDNYFKVAENRIRQFERSPVHTLFEQAGDDD